MVNTVPTKVIKAANKIVKQASDKDLKVNCNAKKNFAHMKAYWA